MTGKELNRDVKKLYVSTKSDKSLNIEEIKTEYKRLYHASDNFKYLDKFNILRMIELNRAYHVIEWNYFLIDAPDFL